MIEVETEPKERAKSRDGREAPRTLEDVGVITIRKPQSRKAGSEIRVAVKVAASGRPALDVREYATRPGDITWSAYEGPTKRGFWLSNVDAELLIEMMARGLVALESVPVDDDGEMIE